MDFSRPTSTAPAGLNVAIGSLAIDNIRTHQKEFSQLCKQSAPGAKAHKPERVKVHLTSKEERYFGDGSTMGAIKAFFWNLVTLCIGYKQCGGDLFEQGKDALDERIKDSEIRARHIANAGIDDANGANQLNWLHHLPSGEVEELISVVHELKRDQAERPRLDVTEGDEVILYTLNTEKNADTYQIVANTEGIWFRQADTDDPNAFKIMSLQEYQNMKTLDEIKRGLTAQARMAFQPYLTLQDIGDADKTSPVGVGDLGGSTALMVLLGIQVGKVEINEQGIVHLITLLNTEAEILARIRNAKNEEEVKSIKQSILKMVESAKEVEIETADELIPICKNHARGNEQTLSMSQLSEKLKALEALKGCLKYKQSATPLIFSSDIASDEIRREMKKVGVIFIAGTNDLDSVKTDKENQAKVCTNAHYDKSTNTLYVNRGIRIHRDTPWLVRTTMKNAFCIPGEAPPYDNTKFSPEDFVAWMNRQTLPRRDDALNFAPTPEAVQAAAHQLGVRIVIASDEIINDHARVLALNPLGSPHEQPVLAARIGRANPTIS